MKKINIFYWIFTGLLCAFMLFSGVMGILNGPEQIELMKSLGYPTYIMPFIGMAKVLGVIALLTPGFPRLKEWAYAGFVIDLLAVFYSFYSMHIPFAQAAFPLVFLIPLFLSYFLYHKRLNAGIAK